MKIYCISYVLREGEILEWFSNKIIAEKRRREIIKKNADNNEFEEGGIRKYDIKLNKKGILKFLNDRFYNVG